MTQKNITSGFMATPVKATSGASKQVHDKPMGGVAHYGAVEAQPALKQAAWRGLAKGPAPYIS